MSKKQVTVTIKRTKRKEADQPYTVTIHPGGKAEPYTMKQRYADKRGARRGALRSLDARTYPHGFSGRPWYFGGAYLWTTPKGVRIVFEYK